MPPKRAAAAPRAGSAGSPAPSTPTTFSPAGLALPGAAAAWAANQIPIDPALQPPTAGYPQPGFYFAQNGYPYATTAQQIMMRSGQSTQSSQVSRAGTSASGGGGSSQTAGDDLATMNDVLGSAGVDLRAEEEGLHRGHNAVWQTHASQLGDRSRTTTHMNTQHIGQMVRTIASHHKVARVPEETIQYLSLALRARLEGVVTRTIDAAKHRTTSEVMDPPPKYPDGTPMWSKIVRRDVAKQLLVLERVEREEELKARAERKEKADAAASAANTTPDGGDDMDVTGDDDSAPKKKRKKDGPGVTAKNMSEEVRKKMSNAAASHAAGLSTSKYAWMHAGNVPAAPKGKGATPAAATGAGGAPAPTTPGASTTPAASTPATTVPTGKGWARGPFVSSKAKETAAPKDKVEDTRLQVVLRDVMFVIERERGHGGGKGSARGWT